MGQSGISPDTARCSRATGPAFGNLLKAGPSDHHGPLTGGLFIGAEMTIQLIDNWRQELRRLRCKK